MLCFFSCKRDKNEPIETDYPEEVEAIIIKNCATAGCHNGTSKAGAGGLDLSTWDRLFEGGNGGSVVVPYRPDFSTLFYYTNTDSNLGLVLEPTMPINATPLSTSEFSTLKNWIQNARQTKMDL